MKITVVHYQRQIQGHCKDDDDDDEDEMMMMMMAMMVMMEGW